LHLLTDAR